MEEQGKLSVACAGTGYFSQFHFDAWRRIEGVKLTGALSLDLDQAAATGCRPYTDLQKMLDRERPQILDIITPPPTHLAFIKDALDAGVSTIICQKPFCLSIDEAREAIRLADAADATLIVHENFRFQPWYRLIREEIEAGAVGELHQITFRLRTGDGQGPAPISTASRISRRCRDFWCIKPRCTGSTLSAFSWANPTGSSPISAA